MHDRQGPVAAAGHRAGGPSVLLLGLLAALNAFGIDSYVAALPTMQRELHAGAVAVQSTVAAYLAGLASGQLLWGWASDRFGRKRPLLLALAVLCLSSLGCGMAGNIGALVLFRCVQAIGSAGAATIAYALVADHWAATERARIFSRLSQLIGATAITAPLLGAGILALASWRAIFVLFSLVAAAMAVWVACGLRQEGRADATGRCGTAGGFRSLLVEDGFRASLLVAGLSNGAMLAVLTASSFVLVGQFGWTSGGYAGFYAISSFLFILCAQWNVVLLRKLTPRAILWRVSWIITLLAALLLAGILSGLSGAPGYVAIAGAYLALLGLVLGNVASIAMEGVPPALAGRAASLLGISQFLAGSLLVPLATALEPVALSVALVFLGCAAGVLPCAARLRASANKRICKSGNF